MNLRGGTCRTSFRTELQRISHMLHIKVQRFGSTCNNEESNVMIIYGKEQVVQEL